MPKLKIIIILLLILVSLGLVFLKLKTPTPAPTNPISSQLGLVKMSPRDQELNVSTDANIIFEFNQNLEDQFLKNCQILLSPPTPLNLTWISPKKLQADPQNRLRNKTEYSLSLSCFDRFLAQTHFTTTPLTSGQIKTQGRQQIQDDYVFAQAFDQLHQDYPWYSQLPIIREKYTIGYNFSKMQFQVNKLTDDPDNILLPDILNDLDSLNAGTYSARYQIVRYIKQ